jgi:hypothetical protein
VAIEVLTGMLANAALVYDIPHLYKKLSEPGANTFELFLYNLSFAYFVA